MSKIFFEMTETEANLNHLLNVVEFADYQIATGNCFTPGETEDRDTIHKINDLTSDASNHLQKAMEKIIDILGLVMGDSEEELPEETEDTNLEDLDKICAKNEIGVDEILEKNSVKAYEVDNIDALSCLHGATVEATEELSDDEKSIYIIGFKTKEGQKVELIHKDGILACTKEYE